MGASSVLTTCPRDCKDAVVVVSPCARHDATLKTSCSRRTDWLRRPAPRDVGSGSMPGSAGCVPRCCVPVRQLLASSRWLPRAAGNPSMTSAHNSLPLRMGTTSVLVRNPPAATSALEASIVRPLMSTSCVDKDREQRRLQQKTPDQNELRTARRRFCPLVFSGYFLVTSRRHRRELCRQEVVNGGYKERHTVDPRGHPSKRIANRLVRSQA